MKRKPEERMWVRRLKLRREVLRTLSVGELVAVGSGCDPQCQVTKSGPCTDY
jgi:hypothetical protein